MIGVEVAKLFRRPRTYAITLLLCLLPLIVAIFLATTRIPPPPGQGGAFLSAVLSNGALYPAAAMALVLPIFLPVSVAVLAGDSVAGEASAGTLRYLLIRPVGRTRLLVAKLVSLIVFVLFAIASVLVTAYLTGLLLFGSSRPPGWRCRPT
ncbi:MAG: type transport system permease protein [Actinoplanes sp.]|nr:type transport system permease protein [Actinoplanes sp.]